MQLQVRKAKQMKAFEKSIKLLIQQGLKKGWIVLFLL